MNYRDVCKAVVAAGWKIEFRPAASYGDKLQLVDPGNRGRLDQDLRRRFHAVKADAEVEYERLLLKRRFGEDSEHWRLCSKAIHLFTGCRVVFK